MVLALLRSSGEEHPTLEEFFLAVQQFLRQSLHLIVALFSRIKPLRKRWAECPQLLRSATW